MPPTLQRDRGLHDTEELVKHEELPDDEIQERLGDQGAAGSADRGPAGGGDQADPPTSAPTPAILTPATLQLDGATTTESTAEGSSVVNIGDINPGETEELRPKSCSPVLCRVHRHAATRNSMSHPKRDAPQLLP